MEDEKKKRQLDFIHLMRKTNFLVAFPCSESKAHMNAREQPTYSSCWWGDLPDKTSAFSQLAKADSGK